MVFTGARSPGSVRWQSAWSPWGGARFVRGARDDPWRCAVNVGRVHRVVSDDGTELAGLVRGQGAPLVLVPGVFGEGTPTWTSCTLPGAPLHLLLDEPQGAVRAAAHRPLRECLYEDVAAFVKGIGEPASLFGHAAGATLGDRRRCLRLYCLSLDCLVRAGAPGDRRVMSDEAYRRLTEAERQSVALVEGSNTRA